MEKNYVVMTDSSADLNPALEQELGVDIIPLSVNCGDRTFLDYPDEREIKTSEFYGMLRSGANAKTAAANVETFLTAMSRHLEQGKDVILDIEIQGAAQVCAKRPETVRIFIAPPSWKELERRLTARGTDTPEKVQKRLLRAQVELKNASDYNYFVINDTVEQAVEELRAILCAEHCKPAERMEYILNGKEM